MEILNNEAADKAYTVISIVLELCFKKKWFAFYDVLQSNNVMY